jgi:hypothetical protein
MPFEKHTDLVAEGCKERLLFRVLPTVLGPAREICDEEAFILHCCGIEVYLSRNGRFMHVFLPLGFSA